MKTEKDKKGLGTQTPKILTRPGKHVPRDKKAKGEGDFAPIPHSSATMRSDGKRSVKKWNSGRRYSMTLPTKEE